MLPVVAPLPQVLRQMLVYTVLMVIGTLVLVPVGDLGWIYTIGAALLGALFIGGTWALSRDPQPGKAMRLFGYSISYVTLLFGVLTLDVLVRNGV
jgi:protoheme IX farnesyltransferase